MCMVGLEFFRCWSCCLFPGGEWQWALELLSNLTDATLQANDVAYNAAISAWRLTDLEGRLLVDVAGVCQLQGLSFVRFCWISVADGAPQLRCKAWPMAGGIGTVPTAEVMITNISTMFLSVWLVCWWSFSRAFWLVSHLWTSNWWISQVQS